MAIRFRVNALVTVVTNPINAPATQLAYYRHQVFGGVYPDWDSARGRAVQIAREGVLAQWEPTRESYFPPNTVAEITIQQENY